MCHWNVIPGWNRTVSFKEADWREGVVHLRGLLPMLPQLKVAVLVGNVAARAEPVVSEAAIPIVLSAHPSVKVRNMNRPLWDRIPLQWAAARAIADGAP